MPPAGQDSAILLQPRGDFQWRCIHYIHIALWVRKVVLNKLDGGFHFKRPVGSLCIVPEEVVHQPDVELFRVKEFILVVVNMLLLTGALLAFGMGIHL